MQQTPLASRSVTDDRAAIVAWLKERVGSQVIESRLADESERDGADNRLDVLIIEIQPVPDQRPDRELPTRLHVTYLVAPASIDSVAGADTVARVISASRDQVLCEVIPEPASDDWWRAMQRMPRPHVRLRSLLVIERDADDRRGPPVLVPLRVEVVSAAPLSGFVVREGHPLRGAVVRLLATGHRCQTDSKGRFVFPNVSVDRTMSVAVDSSTGTYTGVVPAGAASDLVINCTPEENRPERG